jgi:hypothetical protein
MIVVPIENIQSILCYEKFKKEFITKNADYIYGQPIVFKKDNSQSLFDCFVNSKYTNLGFRLAYFLWVLKGSNMLQSLSYYSKHVNDLTDDNMTLRGAYGPRMRFWVGADQLQEAINTNTRIDDPEDFIKPKGVDQLQMCFQDLENGMETSSCVILDPSLDFEDSKNIPDLVSITFRKSSTLDMIVNYGTIYLNKEFVNDYFFLSLLHKCMSSLLNIQAGFIYFSIVNPKFSEEKVEFYEYEYKYCDLHPEDFLIDAFWDNIFRLYDFEKHLRCAISNESTHSEQVDLVSHCEMLLRKFVEPIEDAFWKDYGKAILVCSLLKYGNDNYANYLEDILNTMEENGFKKEILHKIENEKK